MKPLNFRAPSQVLSRDNTQAEIKNKKKIKENSISAEDLFQKNFLNEAGKISLGGFYQDEAIRKKLNTDITLAQKIRSA